MDEQLLSKILRCSTLPSLPAVAMRVLDLTSDPNVSMDDLAAAVQQDQGMAAKVLRTVNSSFYGLRQRCATIRKALVMLGLAPVKCLVLSFSLVSELEEDEESGFDYTAYWRRGLYTATAAKLIAERGGHGHVAEEAFLGGLLQDIGMVAMHRELGDRYIAAVQAIGGDHRQLSKQELNAFELSHAEVGAMLATHWKLPDELVLPIKYHERPTAAPPACTGIVRAVALGNMIHDVLTDPEPQAPLERAYQRASAWFRLNTTQVDDLITGVGQSVRELAQLFRLNTGEPPNPEAVLQRARSSMDALRESDPALAGIAGDPEALVITPLETDALTGTLTKDGFNAALRSAFHLIRSKHGDLSVLVMALDGFGEVCASGPDEIEGEIALSTCALLTRVFEVAQGSVTRLADDLYAVFVPGTDRAGATGLAERFRTELDSHSQQWDIPDRSSPLRVTVSVGLASLSGRQSPFGSPEQLMAAAMRAAQSARAAGGNTVRAFLPKQAA